MNFFQSCFHKLPGDEGTSASGSMSSRPGSARQGCFQNSSLPRFPNQCKQDSRRFFPLALAPSPKQLKWESCWSESFKTSQARLPAACWLRCSCLANRPHHGSWRYGEVSGGWKPCMPRLPFPSAEFAWLRALLRAIRVALSPQPNTGKMSFAWKADFWDSSQ